MRFIDGSLGARALHDAILAQGMRFHINPGVYNNLWCKEEVERAQEVYLHPPFKCFTIFVDPWAFDDGWFTPSWLKGVSASETFRLRSASIAIMQGAALWNPKRDTCHIEVYGKDYSLDRDAFMRFGVKHGFVDKSAPIHGLHLTESGDTGFLYAERIEARFTNEGGEDVIVTMYVAGLYDFGERKSWILTPIQSNTSARRLSPEEQEKVVERVTSQAGTRACGFNLLVNARPVKLEEAPEHGPRNRQERRALERECAKEGVAVPAHYKIFIPPNRSVARLITGVANRVERALPAGGKTRGHTRTYAKSGRVIWVDDFHRTKNPPKGTPEYDAWKLAQTQREA